MPQQRDRFTADDAEERPPNEAPRLKEQTDVRLRGTDEVEAPEDRREP